VTLSGRRPLSAGSEAPDQLDFTNERLSIEERPLVVQRGVVLLVSPRATDPAQGSCTRRATGYL
jgi:hypothetical protein